MREKECCSCGTGNSRSTTRKIERSEMLRAAVAEYEEKQWRKSGSVGRGPRGIGKWHILSRTRLNEGGNIWLARTAIEWIVFSFHRLERDNAQHHLCPCNAYVLMNSSALLKPPPRADICCTRFTFVSVKQICEIWNIFLPLLRATIRRNL